MLTPASVAEVLGVPESDVLAIIESGELAAKKIGSSYRIRRDQLEAYLATGEPLHVAGAFTIDSLGAAFVSGVEGDPHTVVGVSVATVRELAAGFGVAWTQFWNRL